MKPKQPFTKFDKEQRATIAFPTEGENAGIKLNDFFITHILGQGAFGKVYRGELADRNELYAIKSIRKDRLVKQNAIQSTFLELQVLKNAEH